MKKFLGVNIDHIATLRQARKGKFPSPVQAALEAQKGGADGITAHLREDRRHIQDQDLFDIQKKVSLPLNLEMALAPEILQIALKLKPEKVCLVPERRQELTTEGGLNVLSIEGPLTEVIAKLHQKKIEVSLFIGASETQIKAASRVGADTIEIHTGHYADTQGAQRKQELARIRASAKLASGLGLKVNAGHGLDYENVKAIAAIPEMEELNIGFSIISRAVFSGLRSAVRDMKLLIRKS